MRKVVRVLVVDDSAYIRKTISQMLSRSPFIEVVGTATDGLDALEKVEALNPDVVTLDLIMPRMDGVTFLREQMARRPIPVVIVSIASESGEMALKALDEGAIDFVQKPTALATDKVFEIASELVEKIKAAAEVPMAKVAQAASLAAVAPPKVAPPSAGSSRVDAVVIGASTGGPQALRYLIPQLPADLPVPVMMVMHMPVGYTELYAQRLNELSSLHVVEAREGDTVRPGLALLAPAGRHLTVQRKSGVVLTHLDYRPFDMPHRPSVDVLFQSAAEVYGNRILGIILTGMGNDGLQGAAWIKSQGGIVFTEAEETCVVYGMPRAVAEANLSDRTIPLDRMAQAILEVVYGKNTGSG